MFIPSLLASRHQNRILLAATCKRLCRCSSITTRPFRTCLRSLLLPASRQGTTGLQSLILILEDELQDLQQEFAEFQHQYRAAYTRSAGKHTQLVERWNEKMSAASAAIRSKIDEIEMLTAYLQKGREPAVTRSTKAARATARDVCRPTKEVLQSARLIQRCLLSPNELAWE
eukprot:m.429844 g.429844  ORF g.429844 m.429844 type:complete len:172 (-) comp56722_c0_seq1:4042-4557(-)